MRGFAPAEAAAVECARVPDTVRVPGAAAVPCLGGLAVADLLAAPRTLVDRGWCGGCPAGAAAAHPAAGAVAEAAALAVALGVPAPRIESVPTPPRKALPLRPHTDAVDPGRRRLFGGLLRAARAEEEAPVHNLRAPLAIPSRERLLSAVRTMAAETGQPLPSSLHALVRVVETCGDHRVCAAVCPTRALRADESGGATTLSFHPDACIACGRCADSCPERAISVGPWDGPAPDGPILLRRAEVRACDDCGDDFTTPAADGAGLCPACRKRVDLMRDVLSAATRRPSLHSNQGACE